MDVGGKRQFGAILLSRQARRPCRKEAWVTQTEKAVLYLKSQEMGIVSSVGQSTWDLLTSLASLHRLPLRLVVPISPQDSLDNIAGEFLYQFDLTPPLVEFVAVPETKSRSKPSRLAARDEMVIGLTDSLLPVSIRSCGSMGRLTEYASYRGKSVLRGFQTDYVPRREALKYAIDAARVSKHTRRLGSSYLIHWTRTANHQWPGERTVDYYRDLICSERYCRTAFDTLKRILSEKCLRASTRHMPRGYATVAFSRLSPIDVLPLMRWRSRFGEMSFEPYGIGVRLETALAAGVGPVSYISERNSASATPWLCQSIGQKTDWRQEQEYRCLGDLDLKRFNKSDVLAITLHPEEARELSNLTGGSAISFY